MRARARVVWWSEMMDDVGVRMWRIPPSMDIPNPLSSTWSSYMGQCRANNFFVWVVYLPVINCAIYCVLNVEVGHSVYSKWCMERSAWVIGGCRHVPAARLRPGGAPVLGVVPQVRAVAARAHRALPPPILLRLPRPGRLRGAHRHRPHRALQGIPAAATAFQMKEGGFGSCGPIEICTLRDAAITEIDVLIKYVSDIRYI